MSDVIADFAVRIGAIVSPYNAALADAAVNGERFTALQMANTDAIRAANREAAASFSAVRLAAASVGLAVAATAAESAKWGTSFQTQVNRLFTQAGLNDAKLAAAHLSADGLNQRLLDLGDAAGFSGEEVAKALYYPVSASIELNKSLADVAEAEKAAKISGADLTDTTVALTSVMRGYGDSLKDPAVAMAEINAIVGQGMMTFTDFNSSVKNWEPTAATFGVSLQSAGAALDFLTDRGDSATTAGTRLSMMLAMMVGQSKQAAKFTTELGLSSKDAMSSQAAFNQVLKDSGLTVDSLAADLRRPDGIFVALSDLEKAMSGKGMTKDAQDALLTKLFGGGRSFRGVAELTTQLDGVKQKYDAIVAQANGHAWEDAWTRTSGTLAQQLDVIGAHIHNAGIEFGMFLIPKISEGITWLEQHATPALAKFWGGLTGTSGKTPASTAGNPFVNGGLGAHTGVPLADTADTSNWRKAGVVLREVADDVASFATQVKDAAEQVGPVLLRLGQSLATGVGHDVVAGARVLSDTVGPAIKWVADLIHDHEGTFRVFVEVILGGMAAKWALLTGMRTLTWLGDLTAAVVGFPFRQAGQITDAAGEVKTSWAAVTETFGRYWRPVGDAIGPSLSRIAAISTGNLHPALEATNRIAALQARVLYAVRMEENELAQQTLLTSQAEAEAATRRADFLARAAASADGVSKTTQKAMAADAKAAQVTAEKMGVYAKIAEDDAAAAAAAVKTAAADAAAAESKFAAGTAGMTMQAEGAGAASAGLFSRIGGAIPYIGLAVTGFEMFSAAMDNSSLSADKTSASVDQLVVVMAKAGDATSLYGIKGVAEDMNTLNSALAGTLTVSEKFEGRHALTDLQGSMDDLHDSSIRTVEPVAQIGVALGKVNQKTGEGKATLDAYDQALAKLVSSGHADRARQLLDEIRSVTDANHKAMINADRDFPALIAALQGQDAQTALNLLGTDKSTDALGKNADALKTDADAANQAKAAYQAMTDAIDKSSSLDALQRQENDLADTLKRNAEELKGNARDITSSSDAAIANRDALRQMAQSILSMRDKQVQAGGDIRLANEAMADQVVALEQVATKAGLSRDQVDDLLKKFGLIPPSVNTKIKLDSTELDQALDKVAGLSAPILIGSGKWHDPRMYDDGGWVTGSLGAGVPAIVHAGEYVLSRDMLAGRAPIDARVLAALAAPRGGSLPPMAAGSGGGTTIVVPVTVQGAMLSTETAVQQAVITAMTRFGLRNSNTYVPYSSARRRGS